jgi:hypothetical protein
MPLDQITITGTHRGKSCTVSFSRSSKNWSAEILIDGELHERITNDKPCMVTAQRLVDEILRPEKIKRKPAGRAARPKIFEKWSD